MTNPTPPPSLSHNWEEWLPYLEDSDETPEQKRELIEALWTIVLCFVDLGWDVSDGSETCGETLDLKAALEAAVLNSGDTNTSTEPREAAE